MYPLRSVKVGLVLLSVVSCYWLYSAERPNEYEREHFEGINELSFPEKPSEYIHADGPTGQVVKTPPLYIVNNYTRPIRVRVKSGGRVEWVEGKDGEARLARVSDAIKTLVDATIPVKGHIEIPKDKFLQGTIRFFTHDENNSQGFVLNSHVLAGLRIIRIDQFDSYMEGDELKMGGSLSFSYNFTGGANCSMCSEPFEKESEISVLPCAHFVHSSCIEKVIKKHNRICQECQEEDRLPYTFIFKNKGINTINFRDIKKYEVPIIEPYYVDNVKED